MHCILVTTDALSQAEGTPLALDREGAHHLRDVVRARIGDTVRLLDGRGLARNASVHALSRHDATLTLLDPAPLALPPPPVEITLFQCIAKPARMDWLLEKITELGVAKLVPIASAHAVAHVKEGELVSRWKRILDSALCQCNAGWETSLHPVVSWKTAYAAMQAFDAPILIGSLAPNTPAIAPALRSLPPELKKIGILIGPEGDFSPEELAQASALPNTLPVSFGNRILRVETAALFATSAVLASFTTGTRLAITN